MSLRLTGATARRVLMQLRHDPRTVALLLLMPIVLMTLLAWIISDQDFDQYGPLLLGIFPLIIMFLITSVATLRERSGGTLERLLALPLHKTDFILGYGVAFSLAAAAQAVLVCAVCFWLLGLTVSGAVWSVILIAVLVALLGTSMGLGVSALSHTEFQAVQMMPALLLPQLLLCGILGPRSELPTVLRWISDVLPMSYAVDAMQYVSRHPTVGAEFWRDVAVLVGFIVGLLLVGAATLRRRTP
jgi:ABC-2 type transport system permease protein